MLYSQFMHEAMKLVIIADDEASGYSYLNPHYRIQLQDAGLNPENVSDRQIDWNDVAEVLKLEVERRNKVTDKGRFVIDWIFDIITLAVDPAMTSEENDLMKNLMDYMKLNHTLKTREEEVQRKEDAQEQKTNVMTLMPGMNFSKRGAK